MKNESKIEKVLKFPLRAIERNWQERMNNYERPTTIEEAKEQYGRGRISNPLVTLMFPVVVTSAVLYGIAEGGRYLYDKAMKK